MDAQDVRLIVNAKTHALCEAVYRAARVEYSVPKLREAPQGAIVQNEWWIARPLDGDPVPYVLVGENGYWYEAEWAERVLSKLERIRDEILRIDPFARWQWEPHQEGHCFLCEVSQEVGPNYLGRKFTEHFRTGS